MYADHKKRVVTLNVLAAMCERASGFAHKFAIERTSANRAYVSYSNPDEYGSARPMVASFPAYPSGEQDNPFVVLDFLNITNDKDDIGADAFYPVTDAPELFRAPQSAEWETSLEISAKLGGVSRYAILAAALDYAAAHLVAPFVKLNGLTFADLQTGAALAEAPYADGEPSIASNVRANADHIYSQLEAVASKLGNIHDFRNSARAAAVTKAN